MENEICTYHPHLYLYQPTYDFPPNVIADMFGYVFPEVADLAAAGGTRQVQLIIQDDSDFEVRRLSYQYTRAEAAFTVSSAPVPNWTVQLQDSGAGRNLFNNAVPVNTIANGPGQAARDLPWPKILRRNSTIVATFTNYDAAEANGSIQLVMFGRKLFSGAR